MQHVTRLRVTVQRMNETYYAPSQHRNARPSKFKGVFAEGYTADVNYRMDWGKMIENAQITVFIDVKNGVNEKNNHDKVVAVLKKADPECIVNSVTYW